MSASDVIELMIYPFEKIIILLGSIQMFGMSLLSLIAAGIVVTIIFRFFIGIHAFSSIGDIGSNRRDHGKSGDSSE